MAPGIQGGAAGTQPFSGLFALVVDDDRDIREELREYLQRHGMQVEVAASEHVNFIKNQMTWRVVERVDGQAWMDRPVTLQDASSQVSPFVVLN